MHDRTAGFGAKRPLYGGRALNSLMFTKNSLLLEIFSLENSLIAGKWHGDRCDQHCVASQAFPEPRHLLGEWGKSRQLAGFRSHDVPCQVVATGLPKPLSLELDHHPTISQLLHFRTYVSCYSSGSRDHRAIGHNLFAGARLTTAETSTPSRSSRGPT